MANEEAIEVRRERVKRRLIRGMSTEEISRDLTVSVRTVQMDIQWVRKSGGVQLSTLDAKEFIALAAMKQDELERMSWFIYYGAEATPSDKLRALRTIQDIAKDRLEMYQAVGLVPSLDKGSINIAVAVRGERGPDCPYRTRYTLQEIKAVMAVEPVEEQHGETKALDKVEPSK
jgi:hypothetical protein